MAHQHATEQALHQEGNAQGMSGGHPSMQECIQACLNCHRVCLEMVSHCLRLGGKHAAPEHIRLLLDCAEICQTSANFMIRSSNLHARTCGICAEVCQRCADDCARMGHDTHMQACAETCRRCAEACRQMAGLAA